MIGCRPVQFEIWTTNLIGIPLTSHHTTLVLDVLIFRPEALLKFSKQIRVI
jgi:hypothetical protein